MCILNPIAQWKTITSVQQLGDVAAYMDVRARLQVLQSLESTDEFDSCRLAQSRGKVSESERQSADSRAQLLLEVEYLLLTLLELWEFLLLFPAAALQAALLQVPQTGRGRWLHQFGGARRSAYRLRTRENKRE